MNSLRRPQPSLLGRLGGNLLANERGARRFKLAGAAIAANVVSKGMAFVVLIYSTRVALEHLGTDRFGIWITISSISTLLSFVDLGISNALIGRIASLRAGDATADRGSSLVTFGLIALGAIGLLIAVALVGVLSVVPLTSWFKGIPESMAEESRLTGYVFAVLFGLSLPAQGVFKIYAGLQQGWVAHFATALAWTLSLPLIGLAPAVDAPMWFYLFATFGLQQFAGLVLGFGLFRKKVLSRPRMSTGELRHLRQDALFQQGQLFFIIQIAFAIVWGSNQFILSSVIGPGEAATFAVLQRLFMIVLIALAIVNAPLWAMYADARAHGEVGFIRGLLKRSMALTLASASMGVLVVGLGADFLVGVLAKDRISVSPLSVGLMAAWTVLEAGGNAFSMYLNGVGAIRPQAIAGVVYMVVSVPLKIVAVQHWGLDGMLLVMSSAYLVCAVLPFLTYFRSECLSPLRSEEEHVVHR